MTVSWWALARVDGLWKLVAEVTRWSAMHVERHP
jgi:hypothetical protein